MFNPIDIGYFLSSLQDKGKMVYEYNPLKNFRITQDIGQPSSSDYVPAGSIVDMDTELLNFNLNNPVQMDIQNSYDGSVNIILNDNNNIPRMINSRFSALENNTYEIVDRIGNNDTNIYDDSQFDIDSSLYKRVNTIPQIKFNGILQHGSLKVGNYVFYIRLSDADDNESDFVGETGIISIFKGHDNDPGSIDGGFRDEDSYKSVQLTISNIDLAYDYVKIYYTRATSDINENRSVSAYKINQKYPVKNQTCSIIITGNEDISQISIEEINVKYFIADKAKSQVQCQNRFFMGNVNKYEPDHQDLSDISLRFIPYVQSIQASSLIGELNCQYTDNTGIGSEYYSSNNIYNYVGYHQGEIYRFGIVYILNNGTLSPVYNIRGINELTTLDNINFTSEDNIWNGTDRKYISIDDNTYKLTYHQDCNSKGVFRVPRQSINQNGIQICSIGIYMPSAVISYLKDKVSGFFFVRQKRIPTVLAQVFTMPIDKLSGLPIIYHTEENNGEIERFFDDYRSLEATYTNRLYKVDRSKFWSTSEFVGICPEFELRQPYFNSLFTGIQFKLRKSSLQPSEGPWLKRDTYNDRHYSSIDTWANNTDDSFKDVYIQAMSDNMKVVEVRDKVFRGRAGEAEEAWRFEYIGQESKNDAAKNITRGIYSAQLAMVGDLEPGVYYDIYIPGYVDSISSLFQIRYEDDSPYYAIGDRVSLNDIQYLYSQKRLSTNLLDTLIDNSLTTGYINNFYRGDCYICNFTHRLNRNFQDPETPTNDVIVDNNTWKNNYSVDNTESNNNINRGDVNAVELGSWITVKVRSSYNLSIRSLDSSYPDEEALTGLKRGFYPLQAMSTKGNTKIPSSNVINDGFSTTVSERYNYTLPDVPYIKNRYDTRIMYSDLSIGDAFKNGYRVFELTNYRDYPRTYGGIVSLQEMRGNIVCVFEHGVVLIPVNERAISGQGSGGYAYINTSNVLPENPIVLSDTFGSQWQESVIKTSLGIYGVDTVAKKIWRTNGQVFECISDFKISEFLNQNISLTERETTPIIGIRNVKTHYNKFKQDIMFTFYDNLYGFNEKVWNVCYNELLQKWVTFYSWVPSYSENIYNQFFSFNRDTSKWIAKLGASNINNINADGVVLDCNTINNDALSQDYIGTLSLVGRELPKGDNIKPIVSFKLERDNYGNDKYFQILQDPSDQKWKLYLNTDAINLCTEKYARKVEDQQFLTIDNTNIDLWKQSILNGNSEIIKDEYGRNVDINIKSDQLLKQVVYLLNIQAIVDVQYTSDTIIPSETEAYINGYKNGAKIEYAHYQSTIAVIPQYNMQFLTTDFWKHGQSGTIDIADKINPTYWYGKQHPFEFEFVVSNKVQYHKIFDNLQIISNSAEPESFHYEIVGDCYDFSQDKKNMYIRQEATKELYQYNGCDVTYDSKYNELVSEHRLVQDSDGNDIPNIYDKSALMPLYYSRQDTINEIEDFYHLKDNIPTKDFSALAGGEIAHYKTLDEYRIWNHAKAVNMQSKGRLRGNMQYNEDQWLVQINPINVVFKNEPDWGSKNEDLFMRNNLSSSKVPIELGQSPIPNEVLESGNLTYDPDNPDKNDIPQNSMDRAIVSWNPFKSQLSEVKLKDKWLKIRIRYTGDKLAVIMAVKTLYSISYS